MEEWRDIKGYEGKYMVSNLGRVKSLNYKRTGKEKIMKGVDDGRGYLILSLYREGKGKTCKIHKLVAQAFLENPMGYNEVNHKNEDKADNRVENLEWCSRLYNINYGTRNKRSAEKLKGRKQSEETIKKISEKMTGRKQSEEHIKKRIEKTSKPIYSINKESGLIMYWESIREAERCTGISNGNICECLKGKRKSAGGHIWFYAD